VTAARSRARWALALGALLVAACGPSFRVRNYPTPDALFGASLLEYQKKKWDNAVEGFEKVTLELGSRDPLLPAAYLFLARAYANRGEHLVAANTYARISESFPEDSLADDALFEQGQAYGKLWRKPTLDQQYGVLAQSTYRTLLSAYPESPMRPKALTELSRLDEWMAAKDFEIGLHYKRRRAPDSAIIYFRDVIAQYPSTDTARRAGLALLEVYRSIKYSEDATELCSSLRKSWPSDGAVGLACSAPAAPAVGGAKPPAAPPGA
jgi:outer membrane protein assembly factor BamD